MRGLRNNTYLAIVISAALLSTFAQGQTWSQNGPAPRNHQTAVYDAGTDQMIVFGGLQTGTLGALNDVWSEPGVVAAGQASLVSLKWVHVFPTGNQPSIRSGHAAFYDGISNRMIVFGGASNSTTCLNDVWALDDANSSLGTPTWIQLAPSGTKPGKRQNQAVVYDPATNTMIMYGGMTCAGGFFSDVWTLSNANGQGGTPAWAKLTITGAGPQARENSGVVYDSANNVLIVYGGDTGSVGLSDVWTLAHANGQGGSPHWTKQAPTGTAPAARTGHTAVYDSANNRMIVFGGIGTLNTQLFLNDTWILSNANGVSGTPAWSKLGVTGTAPLRYFHSAFYSSAFNDLVVFGGNSQITQYPPADQVFILSGANGVK